MQLRRKPKLTGVHVSKKDFRDMDDFSVGSIGRAGFLERVARDKCASTLIHCYVSEFERRYD